MPRHSLWPSWSEMGQRGSSWSSSSTTAFRQEYLMSNSTNVQLPQPPDDDAPPHTVSPARLRAEWLEFAPDDEDAA